MMAPHWLDDLFEAGNGDYNTSYFSVVQNPRFCSAVQKAAEAFTESKKFQDDVRASGRKIESGSPAQYARVAFLHELNQDDLDRTGFAAAAPSAR